jgi:RNA polymerase sigma factor (TIGR02999 family)
LTNVTQILKQAAQGDGRAADALLPLVYEQLRAIARQRMRDERPDHTLQATALVHEAYARLVGNEELTWDGRGHFFAAATEAMRRILIEHARSRERVKRGGAKRVHLPISVVDLATTENPEEILSVDEAICRLSKQDPRMGEVVRLRFFAGLTEKETAEILGVTDRTVRRDWTLARAWLQRELTREEKTGHDP